MKKILLLLSLAAMLFSCSTQGNELIMPDELSNSEVLYVNPDGSNVMATAANPIYAKLVNATTVHFFWDPQFTMRAILTYDIVLRYENRKSRSDSNGYPSTFARVIGAGTSSVDLPAPINMYYTYVLTGTEEFTGTLTPGGLFHKKDGYSLTFYTNSLLTQQAYLTGNVVVTYGILRTTTSSQGTVTVLEGIDQLIVPQWCESYEMPWILLTHDPFLVHETKQYIILSCVWQ